MSKGKIFDLRITTTDEHDTDIEIQLVGEHVWETLAKITRALGPGARAVDLEPPHITINPSFPTDIGSMGGVL